MTTMQQQSQEHAQQQATTQKILKKLGTTMENLALQSTNSPSDSIRIAPPPSLRAKIELAEFTGADRTLWPTWELQAHGKAISCGPDPLTQLYSIFNRLKDNAAKNVTPWVSRNLVTGTATYEGLLAELGKFYTDPAQQLKALGCLKTMKQLERETFAKYYPKFDKELANAGGATSTESVKVMFLQTSLNLRIRACL